MGNGGQLPRYEKWAMLATMVIVVFVVDATVFANPVLEESVASNSKIGQQAYKKDLQKKVVYEGDQVWRIYKHNDSVNDLVQQYDENGCTWSLYWNAILHSNSKWIYIIKD